MGETIATVTHFKVIIGYRILSVQSAVRTAALYILFHSSPCARWFVSPVSAPKRNYWFLFQSRSINYVLPTPFEYTYDLLSCRKFKVYFQWRKDRIFQFGYRTYFLSIFRFLFVLSIPLSAFSWRIYSIIHLPERYIILYWLTFGLSTTDRPIVRSN